ncbi:hypothetical protein B0J11DRAFT_564695 [Dendryphion nanum]|uniref:Erythromycin biosynthesis protein CIII-like C-terminal domain-containing protein n=1 Tax=Dendryphion nanum TaxID=256645 RepID=A0A9P9ITY9_9PLEO|nr:hypothetical protein B0J11DRAFT_564695 [Dendryphion nanum]
MSTVWRLVSWAIVPLIALLSLPFLAPDTYQTLLYAAQKYSYGTLFERFLPSSFSLPPRSETPLFFTSITHWSHFEKIAAIAVELATLGYPITFLTGRDYEGHVKNLHPNIKFSPFPGPSGLMAPEDIKTWLSMPPGPEQETFAVNAVMIQSTPNQHEALQAEFSKLRAKYEDSKPIILLSDQTALGALPVRRGARGIRPDTSIGISMAPLCLQSNDTQPFRSGKLPLVGPDARAKHWAAHLESQKEPHNKDTAEALERLLQKMGATDYKVPGYYQILNIAFDMLLTLGIPEFEFPRSDVTTKIRYYGAFDKVGRPDGDSLPSWWDDIAKAKKEGKKIIVVSQGTVAPVLSEIVLPTLAVLKDRDDVLVIASTVTVEPEDVSGLVVPENARVAKFIPYDILLPLADVLVSNGGYGAVQHALRLGIPMVVSGIGQDKATTNSIVQWSGVGLNLEVREPGAKKIGDAVGKVLADGSFKKKAMELSKHYKKYSVGKVFDKAVQDAVFDWKSKPYMPFVEKH